VARHENGDFVRAIEDFSNAIQDKPDFAEPIMTGPLCGKRPVGARADHADVLKPGFDATFAEKLRSVHASSGSWDMPGTVTLENFP